MIFTDVLSVGLTRLQQRYRWLIGLVVVFLVAFAYYDDQPGQSYKLLALLFLVASSLIVFLPKRLNLATALVILAFGSISSLVSPIVDVPDEHVHYARSSFLSDGQLNLSNDYDALQISEDVNVVMGNIGQSALNSQNDHPHSEKTTSFPSVLMTNVYYNIGYMPQAIGLELAETLHLTVFQGYILGRLMNVLAYALLVYLAISLAGALGEIIAVVGLLPMNIFLAGSFSQDAVSFGVVFVTVALFFRFLSRDYQIRLRDMVFYTGLCLMIATMKLPYILLIGLPFFLPYEKFRGLSKSQVWLTKLSSVFLLVLVGAVWYKMSGQLKAPEFDNTDFLKQVNPARQVQEIIHHPLTYAKAVLKNVSGFLINLESVNTFGMLTYGIGAFAPVMMMFYFCVVLNNANKVKTTIWTKLGIFLVSGGIAAGISVALLLSWTPVGQTAILGVQGRYFIGIYPLILLFFLANNKVFDRCRNFLNQYQVINIAIYFIVMMLLTTILRYYV